MEWVDHRKDRIKKRYAFCRFCGERLKIMTGQKTARCVTATCPNKIRVSIAHFVSSQGFNIDNLGKKLIDQLIEKNLIRDHSDLFSLDHSEVEVLERMGPKSTQNLLSSIEKNKTIPFNRFINSLGIRYINQSGSIVLSETFSSIEELMAASPEALKKVDGLSELAIESMEAFFNNSKNQKLIHNLLSTDIKIVPRPPKKQKEQSLTGIVFCITGCLQNMSRSEAKQKIESEGGKVTGSISEQIDFLIVGDQPGSKFEKAKELNLSILNEENFIEMLEGDTK